MAGVARGVAVAAVLLIQLLDFIVALQTDFVAGSATLHAIDQAHRLPVNRRHGVLGGPSHGVFAFAELRDLFFVALVTGLRRWQFCQPVILSGIVLGAVAIFARDTVFGMFGQLPVRYHSGGTLGVAGDTSLGLCVGREGHY